MLNFIKRAKAIIDLEVQGLKKVNAGLGREFARAVMLILQCLDNGRKIVVTGMGKNLHIAQKISATLASTGSTSVVLNPAQAMHGDLGILNKGDILLALSYSGESEELVMLLPSIKRMDIKIISLTGNIKSSLGKCSDIAIPVTIEREACPFNMAPTVSTTVTLAVGDALAMVLLEARGFNKQDYAKLHPGGAIGRALLIRVSDIMRSGKRIAVIKKNSRVKDGLLAMTRARSGSVSVIDGKGRLLGIFTDGDLRRHISKQSNLLDLPIEKVMTRNPVTVTGNELAVDVLKVFEEHNIDDLPVVDSRKRLIGSVDIQDLPKLKIL